MAGRIYPQRTCRRHYSPRLHGIRWARKCPDRIARHLHNHRLLNNPVMAGKREDWDRRTDQVGNRRHGDIVQLVDIVGLSTAYPVDNRHHVYIPHHRYTRDSADHKFVQAHIHYPLYSVLFPDIRHQCN